MLKNCVNPDCPNGFFNEYLKEDLMEHKRVFEALGSRMKVEESPNQLSGFGFAESKRNEIIVKVKGATERVMKVAF
jgi:DNA-binding sugar fermentation-stimulating protein